MGEQNGGTCAGSTFLFAKKQRGAKKHGRRGRRPTFLFAQQFRKSSDNHPYTGRQNHGGQYSLPQISLPFFESFLFQLAFVCSAMTMMVTDQAYARLPQRV